MTIDWRSFLTGRRSRDDVFDSFPPDRMEDYQPALLNAGQLVAAARVGARLLQIVARRGGSRVDLGAIDQLLELLSEAMPDSAEPLCDDEAARILDWLETAEQLPPDERDDSRLPPELDLMLAADIESRISVARFALDEGFDLELEYFEADSNTWPRIRGAPKDIEFDPDGEEVTDPVLILERRGEAMELPVQNIRWLMPVSRSKKPAEQGPAGESSGRLLHFPDARADGPDDDSGDGDNGADGADTEDSDAPESS